MFNVFICSSQKILFNLHLVSYGNETGAPPHSVALCMYQIIAATYCEALSSSLLDAPSRRHTVGLLLMLFWVHIWVSHILWETLCHFPPYCSRNIHILGRLQWWNIRPGSFCQAEREWGREAGWLSRLVISRWMTYLKWCDGGILQPRCVGFLIWAAAADLLHAWLD